MFLTLLTLNYQNSASKLNLGNQDEIFDLGNYALINKFKESQLISTKENFQFQAKMYSKIIEKLQSDAKFKNYNFKPLSSRTVVSIRSSTCKNDFAILSFGVFYVTLVAIVF